MIEINKIHNIDVLEGLKQLGDNSVDAIVTDPPYGLVSINKRFGKENSAPAQYGKDGSFNQLSKGFMGKKWDGTGIEYNPELWKECFRVLKHGGYVLSFGGTRTYHKMATAIEDAGFEIRDMINWVYGCLSEDTEILTSKGWERYHKNIYKHHILTFNIENENFEWHKPTRVFNYKNKHPAYRIKSDFTDQIVSRNHRVLIEREGKFIFKTAEYLAREQEANIPFLEIMPNLSKSISNLYKRTSNKKQIMFSKMQNLFLSIQKEKDSNSFDRKRVFGMPQIIQNKKGQTLQVLFPFLQWENEGYGFTEERKTYSQDVRENKRNIEKKIYREQESSMERGSNLLQNSWQLQGCEICKMSKEISCYVPKGWLHNGTPIINGKETKEKFIEDGSNTPYRPQPREQQDRELNVIQEQFNSQEIRRTRATIKEIKYKGNVWCVQVPNSCFVARRNGKIFITGNSGFPKSLAIGKSIDKLQGNVRISYERPDFVARSNKMEQRHSQVICGEKGKYTKGNSEWEGWGTALKPAHEPIVMARKPLSEKSVALNVLKWGTGGINIDESRVGYISEKDKIEAESIGKSFEGKSFDTGRYQMNVNNSFERTEFKCHNQGRFPANLIHDGSDEVLNEFPDVEDNYDDELEPTAQTTLFNAKIEKQIINSSRFFYCAKASKSERNYGCEELPDKQKPHNMGMKCANCNLLILSGNGNSCKCEVKKEISPSFKNNHPTVKPIALMEYLVKMVTPKGGIVLEPFAGSGTTCVACVKNGFNFIGFEKEPEYVQIAEARLNKSVEQTRLEVEQEIKVLSILPNFK